MATPLHALIIGAGSIGGLIDSPSSDAIASHAHAYAISPETELKAICEPSELNTFAFMERWGDVEQYTSVNDLPADSSFEIASIASSTTAHFHDLASLLKRPDCGMILCEKPLVASKEEFHSMVSVLQQTNKKILINLIRRYNPAYIALAERIRNHEFGKGVGFHGVCTKGLLHNGSHILGVLTHFFGELTSIKPFGATHCDKDVCGEFGVSLKSISGTVSVLKTAEYSLFELSFWFEKGVIKLVEGGNKIEIYQRIPSPVYKGYFTLSLSEVIETNLSSYALDSLNFLLHESPSTCRAIFEEHLDLHERIFQTISKVYQA